MVCVSFGKKRKKKMLELWTKPECTWCEQAKKLLALKEKEYTIKTLDVDFSRDQLRLRFPEATVYPVISVDGKYIGGYAELLDFLNPFEEIK